MLVVDDVRISRDVLGTMLEKAGHRVTAVADGISALAATADSEFDAVFLDIHMPLMDGFEVARRVRALPDPTGRTPIVAVTADVLSADAERMARARIQHFVRKPFRNADILEAIKRLVPARLMPQSADVESRDRPVEIVEPAHLEALRGEFAAQFRIFAELIDDLTGEALAEEAHVLAGVASVLGLESGASLCARLETSSREHEDCSALKEAIKRHARQGPASHLV